MHQSPLSSRHHFHALFPLESAQLRWLFTTPRLESGSNNSTSSRTLCSFSILPLWYYHHILAAPQLIDFGVIVTAATLFTTPCDPISLHLDSALTTRKTHSVIHKYIYTWFTYTHTHVYVNHVYVYYIHSYPSQPFVFFFASPLTFSTPEKPPIHSQSDSVSNKL